MTPPTRTLDGKTIDPADEDVCTENGASCKDEGPRLAKGRKGQTSARKRARGPWASRRAHGVRRAGSVRRAGWVAGRCVLSRIGKIRYGSLANWRATGEVNRQIRTVVSKLPEISESPRASSEATLP